jgi:hypothetical protein
MASLTLRSIKGSPLTLAEVDANFTALNTELGTKLTSTSYNAADVLSKLLTVDGANSGLDADLVDGLNPTALNTGNSLVSRNASGNFAAGTITATLTGNVTGNLTGNVTGNLTGNVTGNVSGSAGTLANARTISITGDGSWSASYDGSANSTGALTLTASGVVAGTYTKITVDAKGRATVGASLSSSDVTTALGYTPWHSGNDGSGSGLDADLLDGNNSATAATVNTIALRDGFGDLTANVFKGTATSARYADLAEKYTTDQEYPVGTVIVISDKEDSECAASDYIGQHAIGVISENPAFLMNSESSGQAVAIKGRVPVRVIGPIRKGESLCAATNGQATLGQVNPIAIALKTDLTHEEKLVECFIL